MAAILAFAGSNSSTSINFSLVRYTVTLVQDHVIHLKDMAQYPFDMYSADRQKENGFSPALEAFREEVVWADGIILSVNEHNGNPSAYFKNLLDWLSRMDRKFMDGKPVMLMSTSGGKRGGRGSLQVCMELLPRFGAHIVSHFSLAGFHENFGEAGILEPALRGEHQKALDTFLATLQ